MSDGVADQRAHSLLVSLVETWAEACEDFVTLARSLPEDAWELPTDLAGWSVKDNVAHTAHLESVLAGAPEETLEVPPAPHLTGPMSYYTEQGVLARRGRSMPELVAEIESAVSARRTALEADPPGDPQGTPPRTPGGVGWSWGTLLSNRPLDVWMHGQDIRRAVSRPGGYDAPAAQHVLGVFARALPMIWAKRVGAPAGAALRVSLSDVPGWQHTVVVRDDGRAVPDETAAPVTSLVLGAEDYVVLSGGRRPPEATSARVEGDQDLGGRALASLAVTP